MDAAELFEAVDDRLSGYLNIQGLAKMLPDVTNIEMFDQALSALRLGQGTHLTMPQKMQLALAFISVIGLTLPQKSQVMRLLSASQAMPVTQPIGQPQASGTVPTAGLNTE
jgi:hypothetical protein